MHMRSVSFRPIGYWLKLLDTLIDDDLESTLRPFGLSRRCWQVLNLLAERPHTVESVNSELDAFVSGAEAKNTLDGLVAAGWAQSAGDEVALTDHGRQRLDALTRTVKAARERMSTGLQRSDYDTTVTTLETMCRNLGWDPQA